MIKDYIQAVTSAAKKVAAIKLQNYGNYKHNTRVREIYVPSLL